MDYMSSSENDGAMIALLPTETSWCKIELPHMTLVYAGLSSEMSPADYNRLAKDASSLSMITSPFGLRVTGVDVFGTDEKVDVLKLEPSSQLLAMRHMVEEWNASEHDFSPHCTIGPQGGFLDEPPRMLWFDRLYVGWGDECMTFWLNK